jgi:hypothetical protein
MSCELQNQFKWFKIIAKPSKEYKKQHGTFQTIGYGIAPHHVCGIAPHLLLRKICFPVLNERLNLASLTVTINKND